MLRDPGGVQQRGLQLGGEQRSKGACLGALCGGEGTVEAVQSQGGGGGVPGPCRALFELGDEVGGDGELGGGGRGGGGGGAGGGEEGRANLDGGEIACDWL